VAVAPLGVPHPFGESSEEEESDISISSSSHGNGLFISTNKPFLLNMQNKIIYSKKEKNLDYYYIIIIQLRKKEKSLQNDYLESEIDEHRTSHKYLCPSHRRVVTMYVHHPTFFTLNTHVFSFLFFFY